MTDADRIETMDGRLIALESLVAEGKGAREATFNILVATFGTLLGLGIIGIGWCVASLVELKTQFAAADEDIRSILARHVNEDAVRMGATPYAGLALPKVRQSTPEGPEPFSGPLPPAEPPPAKP